MTDRDGCSQSPDDTGFTLKIDGALTIGSAGQLMELLARSLRQNADVTADFAEVEECDTAGLQLICAWNRTAAARGRRIRVAALSPAIEKTAAALGVTLGDWGGSAGGGDQRGL